MHRQQLLVKRIVDSEHVESISLLGVEIDLVDYQTTLTLIRKCIDQGVAGRYICACPVHPIMVSQKDRDLRDALNNAYLTVPDGMPVVWAAKLLGGNIKDRVYGPELMLRTCQMAERLNHSVFLYGSKPDVLKKLEIKLLERYPTLKIAGIESPPFRHLSASEEDKSIQMLNTASPKVLFLALGAPKQEKWMARNSGKLNIPVTIGVGAAFDFLSDNKKKAPAWMQKRGIEWAFRLITEPRRLWVRYLLYNPLFILGVAKQIRRTRYI